jgi:predicted kinase
MSMAIIMRGLPGSGKTTVAKYILSATVYGPFGDNDEKRHHFSTDNYFDTLQIGYVFDPARLAENHKKNQEAFEEACRIGTKLIICDNTNLKRKYMQPYFDAALKYGYSITELLVGNPKDPEHIKICAARNIHKVPLEHIQKMAEGFEL